MIGTRHLKSKLACYSDSYCSPVSRSLLYPMSPFYFEMNLSKSNFIFRSASTTDNGHAAVMAASAAAELGSIPSHAGEVRQLGPSGSVSFRNPGSASNSSNLTNLRNLWLRIRNGGRVLRGPQQAEA